MEQPYEKRGYLLEDFRLFHLRDAEGPQVESHYHEFHKLLFLRSGNGAYIVEGRRYLLQPGDVVLVGRGAVHRPEIGDGAPYERVILYLSGDFLRQESDASFSLEGLFSGARGPVLRPAAALHKALETRLAALERETRGGAPGGRVLGRALLLQLLVELERAQTADGASLPLPAESGDEKILAILRYINAHITEDISIDALSETFFISKYHMMRRFREETGTPVHAYLCDKRLFLARDLIAGGLAATEACYQSGYKSYSSFSRAYLKRFGVTPTGRVKLYAGEIYE